MSRFPFMDEPGGNELNDVIRRAARGRPLPKRFYNKAEAIEENGEFILKLDGRIARTPARRPLTVPCRVIAQALVDEWNAQAAEINPDSMPFTRIANSAIDAVQPRMQEVIDDIIRYAGSDLIFYRSEGPERLVAEQKRVWDPVLAWSRDTLEADFTVAEGLFYVAQPESAVNNIRTVISTIKEPLGLAALHVMTSLTGSILIPLAHIKGRMMADEAWLAAHVDELFQESIWGKDEEAINRRLTRERDFNAASSIVLGLA